jgi:FK506-binding protein 2
MTRCVDSVTANDDAHLMSSITYHYIRVFSHDSDFGAHNKMDATSSSALELNHRLLRLLAVVLYLESAVGLFMHNQPRRRDVLTGLVSTVASTVVGSDLAAAIVTDETDNFGDNWWTNGLGGSNNENQQQKSQSSVLPSDEVTIFVPVQEIRSRGGLGLELADVEFRTNMRVYVKSIKDNSLAKDLEIKKDWVIVSVNGKSAERTNAQGVAQMLASAVKGNVVELRFRDPSVFPNQLKNLSASGGSAATQVAPAGETTQRTAAGKVKRGRAISSQSDQKVTVSQLVAPKICNRGAETDDLLEISYLGTVVETGVVFDGSAVRINGEAIPGRGNDVSLYLVLGKQPFGQFPPGWDVGLVGMCVGERRRLIIPPVLAYGSPGLPRRGIPPDATLQYDISLVSLNGLSTPQ